MKIKNSTITTIRGGGKLSECITKASSSLNTVGFTPTPEKTLIAAYCHK